MTSIVADVWIINEVYNVWLIVLISHDKRCLALLLLL